MIHSADNPSNTCPTCNQTPPAVINPTARPTRRLFIPAVLREWIPAMHHIVKPYLNLRPSRAYWERACRVLIGNPTLAMLMIAAVRSLRSNMRITRPWTAYGFSRLIPWAVLALPDFTLMRYFP